MATTNLSIESIDNVSQKDEKFSNNLAILGTCAGLVGSVITNIAGNDISNKIGDEKVNLNFVYNLAISKFSEILNSKEVKGV